MEHELDNKAGMRIDVESDGLKMIDDVGSGEARQQCEKTLTWRPTLHSPLAGGLCSAAAAPLPACLCAARDSTGSRSPPRTV